MNYLSLFAGIGGIDLGLDRAGMTCVGQVEIDPFCRRVLARHWPDVPRHDDVRTAGEWWHAECYRPPVDLITGGFPCQPFSDAGRRRGIEDDRWGWPWMADAIETIQPRMVLIENVVGLHRSPAFGKVLNDLHTLGFDAEWTVLSACAVGAPHARERLFVLAYPQGGRRGERGWLERAQERAAQRHLHHWAQEPEPHRVAHGLPGRVERNRAIGNAVVPQVAELIGQLILDGEDGPI